MKNIIVYLIIGLSFLSVHSQQFEFNKILVNGTLLKGKGKVFVSDTIITIEVYKSNTPIQKYKVSETNKTENFSQYTSKIDSLINDVLLRFTLTKTDVYKKHPYQLTIDSKDSFTGSVTQIIYIMALKEDD